MEIETALVGIIALIVLGVCVGLLHADRKDKKLTVSKKFWIYTGAGYALASLMILVFGSSAAAHRGYTWQDILFCLTAAHFGFSWRPIRADEQAVRTFFGKPLDNVSSGLTFVPLFFCWLRFFPTAVQQDELPADPEFIFRAGKREDGSEEPVPEGMFPPIRVPFGYPCKKGEDAKHNAVAEKNNRGEEINPPRQIEAHEMLSRDGRKAALLNAADDDPLNQRVTEEVVPIVRWRVVDPAKFVQNLVTVERARQQFTDKVVAICVSELSAYTPAVVLANTEYFNNMLFENLKKTISDDWGIELIELQIKQINFSHGLNQAVQAKAVATANKQATITEAEGERKKRELIGKGDGAAERAVLRGRTQGMKNMAEEMGVDASVVFATETARAITDNPSDKVIIAGQGGFSDLISAGVGVAESLGGKKKPQESSGQNNRPQGANRRQGGRNRSNQSNRKPQQK